MNAIGKDALKNIITYLPKKDLDAFSQTSKLHLELCDQVKKKRYLENPKGFPRLVIFLTTSNSRFFTPTKRLEDYPIYIRLDEGETFLVYDPNPNLKLLATKVGLSAILGAALMYFASNKNAKLAAGTFASLLPFIGRYLDPHKTLIIEKSCLPRLTHVVLRIKEETNNHITYAENRVLEEKKYQALFIPIWSAMNTREIKQPIYMEGYLNND